MKEIEPIKVIELKTGKERWFAPHLANDSKYMKMVGFRLADIPKNFPPLNSITQKVEEPVIEEAEDVVDEFNTNEAEKPKRGRKPSKNQ